MIVSLLVTKISPSILESRNYEEVEKTIVGSHEKTNSELVDKLMSTVIITFVAQQSQPQPQRTTREHNSSTHSNNT